MSAHDLASTFGRTRLSFASEADIDEFARVLGAFERGEITPDQWRVFRLVRGTYGQRQIDDAQMIRVKIPQGVLTAEQLHALADVAERYSRGFGHITTRQNVQLHFVKLHDVEPAMRRLAEAGLTTREACGNSVRNITACPFAGVAADEPFDVTPYAEALTRFLLRHRLSSSLPRKFKIAFEGCSRDHIKLTINDIGWLARVENGRRGFRVYIGGGTSTMTTAAAVLFDFLPVEEMLNVAEAVIRVFHERGDYQHKQRNRMKFLIKSMGWDAWRAAFDTALADVRAEGGRPLTFDDEPPAVEPEATGVRNAAPVAGRDRGKGRSRHAQGTGHHADAAEWIAKRSGGVRTLDAYEHQAAEAGQLRRGHRHRAARRSQRRTVSRDCRSGERLRRRHRARHARSRTWCSAGYGAMTWRGCSKHSRPPVLRCRMPTPLPMSRVARARSRASSR